MSSLKVSGLLALTSKDFKAVQYELADEPRRRTGIGVENFRRSQSGICEYLPCRSQQGNVIAYENALVCCFCRRLCMVIERRFGVVPILSLDHLLGAECKSKEMLEDPRVAAEIKRLPAVRFAERGVLGVHIINGITVVPDKSRVFQKVLTLLMAFNDAINIRTHPSHTGVLL